MASDPFRHLPALAGMIVDPEQSFFRNIDHSGLDRKLAGRGITRWRRSEEEREVTRLTALGGRPAEDLWVFAYGSLMWDPAFRFAEIRRATVHGYQRRFCLFTNFARGSLKRPGLMAALDTGGSCQGLVFRIERERVEEETRVIWSREMNLHAYKPRFVQVASPQGEVEALAFLADHTAKTYRPDLSLEETARYIATGVGFLGKNIEYLDNLVAHFKALDIEDDELLALHALAKKLEDASAGA